MLTVTKEPKFARYTSDKAIIKDHYYYRGNDFSWNKAARMVEKYYPFYHKQHDENRDRVSKMKEQQDEDKKMLDEMKRDRMIEMKAQDKFAYENRAKERTIVQHMSKQRLFSSSFVDEVGEDEGKAVYEVISKRVNSGKCVRSDEFGWNLLPLASKKNVKVFLGDYSVKGEEQMINNIKKRIEKDQKEEDDANRKKQERHDKIRNVFLTKHDENMTREETVIRPTTSKSSKFNSPRMQSPYAVSQPTTIRDEPLIKFTSLNTEENMNSNKKLTRPMTTASIDRLAQSRQHAKRDFKIDDSDLKGMLVQNMHQNLFCPGNNFYESLSGQSKVFTEILEDNRRHKTESSKQRETRPYTASTNKSIKVRPFTSSTNSRPATVSRPATSSIAKIPSRPETRLTAMRPVNENIEAPKTTNTESFNNTKNNSTMKMFQANDDINNKECALDEINAFENAFCRNGKKVGYARVNLEEAYRLTSADGLTALQKIEAKKLDPLVK